MKKLYALLVLVLATAYSYAQQTGNVILFTSGEKFYAVVNGQRQNLSAETNIQIKGLNAEAYKLSVIFEDQALGSMEKNMYVKLGYEVTYHIKQNKKGQYKLGYMSEVPLAQAPAPAANVMVVNYGTPVSSGATTTTGGATAGGTTTDNVTTTTTTTTTTEGGGNTGNDGFNFGMNVDIDDNGENVSINMGGMGTGTGTGTTTTTSSSTTTTTTTTSSSTTVNGVTTDSHYSEHTSTTTSGTGGGQSTVVVDVVETEPASTMTTTTSSGCFGPMGSGDYADAKKSISAKSFSDSKMTLAKQVTKNNCLSSDQVKGIVQLFDFESDRLEFAKFAYDYTFDQNNYYKVNDAFEFESSIEELDEYIQRR